MPGPVCRAVGMASAGRRACLYRLAHPLPLGAGEYVRPAVIGSACGEGVGVSSRFSLSRCSSSCHLVAPAVIASLCLLRRPVLVVPCSHRSRLPCPMCFVPCPVALSSCPLVVIPVFSCGFLSSFSPFLRLAGLGVLCLLASFVAALVPSLRLSSRSPCVCLPSGIVPLGVSLSSSHASCSVPPVSLVSYRPILFVLSSPFFYKRWRGACRLVICLLSLVSVVRAAGGVGWIAAARRACCLVGRCRLRGVFGLWCRCLYI